ncbi:MAG: hypothetical protein Q8L20_10680 [Gammaproteobacteria bacterium]|nr:hypothetical protein [Gammaproteobacteria bacterium]
MSNIIRGRSSIGLFNDVAQSPTLPFPLPDALPSTDEIIAGLIDRLSNVETILEGKANANGIRTLIAYSDEEVLIQAQDIVLVGTVTIAQIIAEQNGTTSGALPISITQIVGDVIRTGTILSNNWGASAGTALNLNAGTMAMGGSSAPKFLFDGSDLTISGSITAGSIIAGSVTVGGVALSTISSNAASGKSISDTLLVSGTAILAGVIQPNNTGAIRVGSITWNSTTGALTGGTGIAITEWGIIGAASGVATFSIQASNGNATFAGALAAATGTFAGDINTTGHVKATGGILSVTDTAALVGEPASSSVIGVIGRSVNSAGVKGVSTNAAGVVGDGPTGVVGSGDDVGVVGRANLLAILPSDKIGVAGLSSAIGVYGRGSMTGVYGQSNNSAGAGVHAHNTAGGAALIIESGYITKSNVSGHYLSVYDETTNALIGTYRYSFHI